MERTGMSATSSGKKHWEEQVRDEFCLGVEKTVQL